MTITEMRRENPQQAADRYLEGIDEMLRQAAVEHPETAASALAVLVSVAESVLAMPEETSPEEASEYGLLAMLGFCAKYQPTWLFERLHQIREAEEEHDDEGELQAFMERFLAGFVQQFPTT